MVSLWDPCALRTNRLGCGLVFALLLASCLADKPGEVDSNSTEFSWIPCADEAGVNSTRHEEVLNLLNGRKLAFVGDSLTRYQYLELAYYIINGRCQDPDNPGDNGFILNLYTYPSINDFLKQSPKVITNDTPELFAKEYVFGARVSMQHGYTKEDRAFLYTDKQGRTIEMIYMQYFHELYARLHQRLVAADNFKPTDVFINFGVWFVLPEPRDTTCGEIEDPESKCPYMPALCDYFKEDHDYNVYWMASSPSRDTDEATELNYNIGPGHNLNPSTKCDMSNIGVNNRSAMIEMLVPEDKDRYKLFWDRHHFKTPDPYHAMNWDLIKQVKKMVGSGAKDNR